ncbi:TetR/AcrR family transcriptional regulator [Acetobacter estunensis]|uniref:TetR/AcrR family transcriptional regulator n=1 Tax=Acetobacter estunensis TaxID=104097 RepID=UPI001C2CEA13|nr:TetR/AcrR family transcriptional regulator [Acetobacter estunensis]MBV1838467.1 TetR/AcrR family transcriptional regulator [Acetobacter estunensis]
MSEELDALILKTAGRLFGEQGYAATSIEQIAAVAQVGKQTIYRRHASKEDLFKTVISELGHTFLKAVASDESHSSDKPLPTLHRTLRRLLDLVLDPETIALSRTFVGEGWRFPDLITHAGAHIFDPLEKLALRFLTQAETAGQLKTDCKLQETSRILVGLLLGWPHQQVLFGRHVLSHPDDRDHYFNACWNNFMHGVLKPDISCVVPEKTAS